MTSPAQRHREGLFARVAQEQKWVDCYVNHLAFKGFAFSGCSGRLQAAHVISRQSLRNAKSNMEIAPHRYDADDPRHRLRDVELDDLWADDRNGIVLCQAHHAAFDKLNGQKLILPFFPDHVHEFAEEFGLGYRLPDTLRSERKAA